MPPSRPSVDPVESAITALAAGRPVVVADDVHRENEGDLILAAQHATPELVAFFVRYTSGVLCVAMNTEAVTRLRLPPMVPEAHNSEALRTAFTVSVDLACGTTTGISAADRAATIVALADPGREAGDFTRPGHVFPLQARSGGVLERPGHTEASVELVRAAGLRPAALLCEIVNDDGTMAQGDQLAAFAARHGLVMITIAELLRRRLRRKRPVTRIASARLPTRAGSFDVHAYRSTVDGREHLAVVKGDPATHSAPLVRVHSECLTGDAFGSVRCDCGAQLQAALARIEEEKTGVLVYVRGHEGRGIGLGDKIRAYALQDLGADTVDANLALGLPVDSRDYAVAALILSDLRIRSVRLMTNNPLKARGLQRLGVRIASLVPLVVGCTSDNVSYLNAKRRRLGHLLSAERPTGDVALGGGGVDT